jgi:hypothetical protein
MEAERARDSGTVGIYYCVLVSRGKEKVGVKPNAPKPSKNAFLILFTPKMHL